MRGLDRLLEDTLDPNRNVDAAFRDAGVRGGGSGLEYWKSAPYLPNFMDGYQVKSQLKANTEEAIARGLFGVPTFELDGKLFWGVDALPMLSAYLRGDPWFDGPAWDREGAPREGVVRR